jgi:thiol-disulfide isomerase/thioredoxin
MLPKYLRRALISVVLILAACGPAATSSAMSEASPTSSATMGPSPTTGMMETAPTAGAMMETTPMAATPVGTQALVSSTGAMMSNPSWYSASFTDARTGSGFSIDSFKGKVILVETLAIWCPTCLSQEKQVLQLQSTLGQQKILVTIGIDIDTNETLSDLKAYVMENGFDWYYGTATSTVAQEIGSLYGNQFLNPPSTPMLIIDQNGEAHPLPYGVKSAKDLKNYLAPYLGR